MRGKVNNLDRRIRSNGITPAYAGKSFVLDEAQVLFEDHPRLCGEKMISCGGRMLTMGSPPPMRGKVVRFIPILPHRRITPAYAGKSCCLR